MQRPPLFTTCAALAVSSALQAADTMPLTAASGADLYAQLCVSCHGPLGKGDGPVAPALKTTVPDLTRISAREGRKFPEERLREMIDGRAALPAHGTREMPVWGYELEARVPAETPGRAAAQGMTDRLVEYLRSIQE
jgi:mono/diheme cytochrome c family protein